MIREKEKTVVHGFVTLPIFIAILLFAGWQLIVAAEQDNSVGVIGYALLGLAGVLGLLGHPR